VVILFFKEFQFSIFDPEMAEVSGIPAGIISLMLSVLMGLTIVISLQAVGELMVIALIVLPASIAYQLSDSLKKMIIVSVIIGITVSIFGLIIAFYLDAPSGSTIVIMLGITFLISLFLRPRSGYATSIKNKEQNHLSGK
jgi:ABC-type Mn2+/Zn2+ transport system permease subunit